MAHSWVRHLAITLVLSYRSTHYVRTLDDAEHVCSALLYVIAILNAKYTAFDLLNPPYLLDRLDLLDLPSLLDPLDLRG